MLVDLAGPTGSWEQGEVIDMTPEQAAAFADGERGELVTPATGVKAAETPEGTAETRSRPVETRKRPTGQARW